MLRVEEVSFSVPGRTILHQVSIEARAGETLALLGASGSGKSTLLRIIAGLERPDSGQIVFEGQDVTGQPPDRRGFGMMFQEFALFPHLTVAGNLGFGLRRSRIPRAQRRQRVAELLDFVGLRGYEARTTEALSGGERQRVALARALAPRPRLLMLDEPLGSLDRALRQRLVVELKQTLDNLGIPAIYVTHDQPEAFAVADRVALLEAGRIVRVGRPQELYDDPRTAFVARYLGLSNIVPGFVEDGRVRTAVGAWPVVAGTRGGAVQALLRGEVSPGEPGMHQVVSGSLISSLFQGARSRVAMETAAGPLEFDLPADLQLPPAGSNLSLRVPEAQVLEDEPPNG